MIATLKTDMSCQREEITASQRNQKQAEELLKEIKNKSIETENRVKTLADNVAKYQKNQEDKIFKISESIRVFEREMVKIQGGHEDRMSELYHMILDDVNNRMNEQFERDNHSRQELRNPSKQYDNEIKGTETMYNSSKSKPHDIDELIEQYDHPNNYYFSNKKPRKYTRRPNHEARNRSQNKRKKENYEDKDKRRHQNPKQRRCYECGEVGHLARSCENLHKINRNEAYAEQKGNFWQYEKNFQKRKEEQDKCERPRNNRRKEPWNDRKYQTTHPSLLNSFQYLPYLNQTHNLWPPLYGLQVPQPYYTRSW
jgi:hypothetical protein